MSACMDERWRNWYL